MKSFVQQTVGTFYLVFTACLIASPITLPLIKETDPCTPYEYICKGGKCISQYNVCDSNYDCPDGEDENITMCRAKPCDPSTPYKCFFNGICIPYTWLCDGQNDCGDNSDEVRMTCVDLLSKKYSISLNYSNPHELEPSADED